LVPAKGRWCSEAGEVTAGLAESNGSLPPGGWLTVTCRLTASTPGSAPGRTLGIEYGKAFTFIFTVHSIVHEQVLPAVFTSLGAKYCSERACVCLSVCPHAFLKNHASKLREIFCTCYCVRSCIVLWGQCIVRTTLCTSGFVNDVRLSIIAQTEATPMWRVLKVSHRGAEARRSLRCLVVLLPRKSKRTICRDSESHAVATNDNTFPPTSAMTKWQASHFVDIVLRPGLPPGLSLWIYYVLLASPLTGRLPAKPVPVLTSRRIRGRLYPGVCLATPYGGSTPPEKFYFP